MVVAESFLREDAATEDRNYAFLRSSPTSPAAAERTLIMTAWTR
jgi:hypothetical protein